MAYFYQHIKGLTSRGTSWKIDCEQIDGPAGSMETPQLLFTKTGSSSVNIGNFITSDIENGVINKAFTFNNKLYFTSSNVSAGVIIPSANSLRISGPEGQSAILDINNSQFKMEGTSSTSVIFRTLNTWTDVSSQSVNVSNSPIAFHITDANRTGYYGFGLMVFEDTNGSYDRSNNIAETKIYSNVPFYLHNYLRLRGSNSHIDTDGYIHSGSYIEGTYFNATSDKRAKTGINQSTFSALNIIKSLPIYNFKYKSDGSDSIGIIAQEALKVNAGDFSLVANAQASGENGDYMSVKESKLVYVAWKAIQEQQEIIDKQSKEIEELKQLVKTLIEK